jgi:hypothetical protein
MNKGNNLSREYKNCKCICTELWLINFIKQTLLDTKGQTVPGMVTVGDFNFPTLISRFSRQKSRNFADRLPYILSELNRWNKEYSI